MNFWRTDEHFVLGGGSLALLPWLQDHAVAAPAIKSLRFDKDPFQLGVASVTRVHRGSSCGHD